MINEIILRRDMFSNILLYYIKHEDTSLEGLGRTGDGSDWHSLLSTSSLERDDDYDDDSVSVISVSGKKVKAKYRFDDDVAIADIEVEVDVDYKVRGAKGRKVRVTEERKFYS